jgi:hypothetical protein
MLAITILVTVIIPMLNFLASMTALINECDIKQKAILLAQKKMEELMIVKFSEIDGKAGEKIIEKNDYNFKQIITIKEIESDIKEINVEIAWEQSQVNFIKRIADN